MKRAGSPWEALRARALRLPEVTEGIACAGTPIEKRTLKVRGKAFLFLGPRDAMLKLRDSLPEARRLAKEDPERIRAGAGGWVVVKLAEGERAPPFLAAWTEESHRLMAGGRSATPSAGRRSKEKRRRPA